MGQVRLGRCGAAAFAATLSAQVRALVLAGARLSSSAVLLSRLASLYG
jgi:hypothetical protein